MLLLSSALLLSSPLLSFSPPSCMILISPLADSTENVVVVNLSRDTIPNHARMHAPTHRDGFWGALSGVCLASSTRCQHLGSISRGGDGDRTPVTFWRPPHVVYGGKYSSSRSCTVQRYMRMIRRKGESGGGGGEECRLAFVRDEEEGQNAGQGLDVARHGT